MDLDFFGIQVAVSQFPEDQSSSDSNDDEVSVNELVSSLIDETRSSSNSRIYASNYDETLVHYENNMEKCTCSTSLYRGESFKMEIKLRNLSETERVTLFSSYAFLYYYTPSPRKLSIGGKCRVFESPQKISH